jgi:deoxyhypusine synthase
MKPVKDIKIEKNIKVSDLMEQFVEAGGFEAKKVGDAAKIYKEMLADKECVKFFSFPACIVSTGTRGVIKDMVKNKMVDVIITTCGMIDHDLARLWRDYYQGYFEADDAELRKKGINRLGNVFIPNDSYGIILEKKVQPILEKLHKIKKEWSTRDLIWAFGEAIENEPGKENSIVYWAWKNKIPVFIPGPTDGSWGAQMWMFYQTHKDFKINILQDEDDLSEIVFNAKKAGALMLGGGISKHHVIWWNQFRDGLDYAIQVTTAPEWDGSLSGAQVREAISWGKVKPKAKQITVEGDVTVLLPLLIASVL